MKFLPLSLMLLPLLSFQVLADEKDFDISITGQGTIGQERSFEMIALAKMYSADTLLQPYGGYRSLYARFEKENANQISVGVWQKAQSFNEFLQKCNINIPVDSLVMRIGHDAIFSSKSQTEIDNIAEEVGQHLSFEKKIAFAAQLGGSLNAAYDKTNRESTDIVTMMDMVKARQNGTKAGVCRDMHYAMAQIMVKMGVPDTFIVATQVVGGGHAVMLSQDPNDPSKTYMVNYGNVTTQQSADSSAHMLLNATIPSIGHSYRIYSANGKPVATLPTGLGILLNDFLGKDASNLDPYSRSQSTFATVNIATIQGKRDEFRVSLGAGISSDKDKVVALSGQYMVNDEHFPMEVSMSLYNMRRDTPIRGEITSNSLYIDGTQHVRYTPVKDLKVADGNVDVEVYGRIGVRYNFSMASEEIGDKNKFSAGSDVISAAGTRANYVSNDGKTNVRTNVEAVVAMDKSDVRNENSVTFDLRNITGSVIVSRELARTTSGYRVDGEAGVSAVVRPGLGTQSRQDLSFRVIDDKGRSAALTLSHEGQVQGRTLAFVPGSLETYSVEGSVSDRNRNSVGAAVFCSTYNDRKSCGTRATGRLRF